MDSMNRTARNAGLLYLSMSFFAPFSLMYVPSKIVVADNAAAITHNLIAHEGLLRIGIVSDLVVHTMYLLTVLMLYRLLRGVNRTQAMAMLLLAAISIPVGFFNIVNEFAALAMAKNSYLGAFSQPQREAMAMLFMTLRNRGNAVAEMFWGLWLFPFGTLVFRSRFLPRFLGVWLWINGAAYVVLSVIAILAPPYANRAFRMSMPALFGELAIALWLALKGAGGSEAAVAEAQTLTA